MDFLDHHTKLLLYYTDSEIIIVELMHVFMCVVSFILHLL